MIELTNTEMEEVNAGILPAIYGVAKVISTVGGAMGVTAFFADMFIE